MALGKYKEKRDFKKTPEPAGKRKKNDKKLLFVVQKHDATRLHYDFRLELDGVLKSWAIPKGPSMNPEDKRLAMMVEDHPYDYKDFEGIIPKGNYGAGTVIVWDEGTYGSAETGDDKEEIKKIREGLKKGDLKIILNGQKLKGEFALVHMKSSKDDNAWLMIKKRDKFATEVDITKKDKSVKSNKTIEQIERAGAKGSEDPPAKSTRKKKSSTKNIEEEGGSDPFPHRLIPMLAKLTGKPFDDPDWIFEIKWDGYRAIAEIENGSVHIH
jgi:bifunctional non-homologous end joining protein LigD